MSNPFETIEERLNKIETLLYEIKELPDKEKQSENLNVKEAAEILKVSEQSIHNYIKKGFLPAKKIGRAYLIKRVDLEDSTQEVKSMKYRRS